MSFFFFFSFSFLSAIFAGTQFVEIKKKNGNMAM